MKRLFFINLLLILAFLSCTDESVSKDQEIDTLQEQFAEIMAIAEGISCENSEDWTFTSYGSKACGGPQGFIAYALTIDTVAFLERIEAHRIAERQFNIKWGIVSDCAITTSPISVACENGKPILIYQ